MALTDVRNAASIAVLERLGFVRDPAMREPVEFKGELCRSILYLLTPRLVARRIVTSVDHIFGQRPP